VIFIPLRTLITDYFDAETPDLTTVTEIFDWFLGRKSVTRESAMLVELISEISACCRESEIGYKGKARK
jgi:hypothetical protein